MFKNNLKKQYYKFLVRKISRSIWDMELRVVTIKEIREGIRGQFDQLSSSIKGCEVEIENLFKQLEIPVGLREELQETKKAVKEEEMIALDKEGKEKLVEDANRETKRLRKEWILNKRKATPEDMDKVLKHIILIVETKEGFEKDSSAMQEQMMGKWVEKQQRYVGGIDEEVKSVEMKIDGGFSYRSMVERELKKI